MTGMNPKSQRALERRIRVPEGFRAEDAGKPNPAERDNLIEQCLADVKVLVGMFPGDGPWTLDAETLGAVLTGAWFKGVGYRDPTQPS